MGKTPAIVLPSRHGRTRHTGPTERAATEYGHSQMTGNPVTPDFGTDADKKSVTVAGPESTPAANGVAAGVISPDEAA